MLDENILQEYINNFYGFGDWENNGGKKNPIWYIGIEEGGGKSERDVQKRLDSWVRQEKKELIDNEIHHLEIDKDLFEKGEYQHTWARLIRLRLSYDGKDATEQNAKEVQMNNWGHLDSNNLLTELFPLPSPKNSAWNYGKWTNNIPYLKTRKKYYEHIDDNRIDFFRKKIKSCSPKIVVLYGNQDNIKKYWNKLVGVNLQQKKSKMDNVNVYKSGDTCFFQTPHPVHWSVSSYDFWTKLGQLIKDTCS